MQTQLNLIPNFEPRYPLRLLLSRHGVARHCEMKNENKYANLILCRSTSHRKMRMKFILVEINKCAHKYKRSEIQHWKSSIHERTNANRTVSHQISNIVVVVVTAAAVTIIYWPNRLKIYVHRPALYYLSPVTTIVHILHSVEHRWTYDQECTDMKNINELFTFFRSMHKYSYEYFLFQKQNKIEIKGEEEEEEKTINSINFFSFRFSHFCGCCIFRF